MAVAAPPSDLPSPATVASTADVAPDAAEAAGFNVAAYLMADRVVVADGKLTYREFKRCKVRVGPNLGQTRQFEWSAEAPVGLLSRDAFLQLNVTSFATGLLGVAGQLGIDMESVAHGIGCESFQEARGPIHLKSHTVYTLLGPVTTFTDPETNQTSRTTQSCGRCQHSCRTTSTHAAARSA